MIGLRALLCTVFIGLGFIGQAQALTWDEPWHREVVSQATSFGLYRIEKNGPDTVTLKRVRHIAGDETAPTVELNAFYALRVTSKTGNQVARFELPADKEAYFHLKRTDSGWAIATPSAGYANFHASGKVLATYRISAHQALIEPQLYEDTQRCIFNVLHGAPRCDQAVIDFIDAEVAKPVEGLEADSTLDTLGGFFRQHAALETASLIGYTLPAQTLERFLAKPDTHVQMAALRALAASANNDNAERLMRFVEDEQATLNARTLAALLLADMGARQMKQRLQDYAPRASTEETGLGIKIMDQRIGTNFPHTLKDAVELAARRL